MKEPIAHWPGRLLELGGATVHVRSTPEGPDEAGIFVHGLAGSATNWTDLMGELSGELAGHAIDLPGAGYSPAPPDGDYSVSGHARAVLALVEHVAVKKGAGPVHLFGNSLGGAVSVRVAAMRPDLVRTLTLVSPALPDIVPRYGPARVALSATPGLGDWVAGRLRYIPAERRIRATMAMCYADSGRVHPERLRDAVAELVRRDGLPYSGRALVESARGIVAEYFRDVLRGGDDSLWRQAARVQAPTLVVHGMRDRLVHARTAARAARTFPDVRLVVLPKAAHVAQMEYPEVVAREVRALIRHARARV
jgi:pimeloyl-ACP methyl ester carboxylesterase